jgi:hypothetical protein
MAKRWVYDPHSGGKDIPEAKREKIRQQILTYAEAHYAGKYTRLEVRFKGKFCPRLSPTAQCTDTFPQMVGISPPIVRLECTG